VVKQAPTTSLITSSANPSANPTVNISVSGQFGGTPTGSINFADTLIGGGTTAPPSVALSGGKVSTAIVLTGAGIHHLVASYAGDTNYLPSSDGIWQVVSSGGAATTLKLTGPAGQLKLFRKGVANNLTLQLTSATSGTATGAILVLDDDTVLASSDGSAGQMLTKSSCGPAPSGQFTVACYTLPLSGLTIGQHQIMAVAANDGTYDGAAANNGQPLVIMSSPQPH
jgi:hypothetical protein